ncbi:MAG: ribosomal protein S18-alanine N-acetyltransferase [Gemmatimonadota bacterium]
MNAQREQRPRDLVVRSLSVADLPKVMPIERDSFSMPWRETTFQGLLGRDDSELLGAMREEDLVGYAVCWWVGSQAELGNVAVRPSERGQGTGRRLIEEVLVRLLNRGVRECFLEVRESNDTARSLYEQCGFSVVGRRRNYYARPSEDALVMRKDLV